MAITQPTDKIMVLPWPVLGLLDDGVAGASAQVPH